MDEIVRPRLNRVQLQLLAERYAVDAALLLEHSRWSSAYYLAGYAVECALKACIAMQFKENDFPDLKTVQGAHTHKLTELLRLSGLKEQLEADSQQRLQLIEHWRLVSAWSEASRYEVQLEVRATAIVQAVSDTEDGVLTWLKKHW